MYIDVRYSKSALKHVTKEDIQRAMINVIYDDILDDYPLLEEIHIKAALAFAARREEIVRVLTLV